MIVKRFLFVVVFQIVVLPFSLGQVIDLNAQLSKEQMYKDFDEFVQIIRDINIQGDVREKVTGYNPLTFIQQQRSKIENIDSYRDFIGFLENCLSYTMSVHAGVAENLIGIGTENIDTQIAVLFISEFQEYKKQRKLESSKNSSMGLGRTFYYSGDYYVYGTQKMIKAYSEKKDTIIVSDMRLILFDGQLLDSLFWRRIPNMLPSWIKWDYCKKKYYTDWLSISDRKILVEDFPTKKQYELPLDSLGKNLSQLSFPDSIIDKMKINREKSDDKTIKYYDSLGLLYIYMGSMNNDKGIFADSIKRIGQNKPIKKIIIDVRDNGGGSDYAWGYILRAIIKDTIIAEPIVLAMKNNEFAWKYIDIIKQDKKIQETKLPFLDNLDVVLLPSSGIYSIQPDSNSLAFEGTIYILQNERVYSAAQSLITYAKQNPQLVSVGVPTGTIAGRGYGRFIFQLKESKFTFFLDATIDVTDCTTAEDVFHDRPEIEIYPTIDEIIETSNYGRYLNKRGDEFLFKYDYLFKKVLEME